MKILKYINKHIVIIVNTNKNVILLKYINNSI